MIGSPAVPININGRATPSMNPNTAMNAPNSGGGGVSPTATNKEAVAALSAALAFRRFEAPPRQERGDKNAATNDNNDGNLAAASTPNLLSPSSSIDPMGDSLRRLSSILNLSKDPNGSFSLTNGLTNGNRLLGMRRGSLDTIMSSCGAGGSLSSSGRSTHGVELRGSLSSSCRSGHGVELPSLPGSLRQRTYKMAQRDDGSLNSVDLDPDENDDQKNGGSMTISQLEGKKLSRQNQGSDDEDEDGHEKSVDIFKEEGSENASSSRGGFVNSLQKIFDSSHNSRGQGRSRKRGSSKASSTVSSSHNSSLKGSNSSFSKSGSLSTSSKRRQRSNASRNSYQNWKKRYIPSSSRGSNGNSHNDSSHDNNLSRRDKLEIRLEEKDRNNNSEASNKREKFNNSQSRNNRTQNSRNNSNNNSYNNSHGNNSYNNSHSNNSYNNSHNSVSNNWKDNSHLSANLSGCLKHPPPLMPSQPTPQRLLGMTYNPKNQKHPQSLIPSQKTQQRPLGMTGMTYNPKKRARVSWKVDDQDGELNFSTNSKPPQLAGSALAGAQSASLTVSALENSTLANLLPNNTRKQRSSSLFSEGDASLDLDTLLADAAMTAPAAAVKKSLAADEELLLSMIQILAHQSSELKPETELAAAAELEGGMEGEGNKSDSTWGIGHYDVSAASGLNKSLNGGNLLFTSIPKRKGACSSAAVADGNADEIVGRGDSVEARVVPGDEHDGGPPSSPAAQNEESVPPPTNATPNETAIPQADAAATIDGKDGAGKQEAAPVAPNAPVNPEHIRDLVRRTSCSTATVTRLANQEVEDYRARLQRKRAAMETAEVYQHDSATNTNASSGSTVTTTPFSQEESQELNELLFENATNISNAVLLQRALYTLRINNNVNYHHPEAGGIRTGSGGANAMEGSNESLSSNANERSSSGSSYIPRAHSEHSGIDRMALNHFLSLSSSVRASRTSDSTNNNNNGNASATNAPFANDSNATNTSNPSPTELPGSGTANPFASFANRRRNTYLEGRNSAPPIARNQSATLQIGAIQSNEPAPLLYERAFSGTVQNRRERRAEARRHTLHMLERERRESATPAERRRSSSAGEDASDRSLQYRRMSSGDRSFSVNDVNFNDSGGGNATGDVPRGNAPVRRGLIRNSFGFDSDEEQSTVAPPVGSDSGGTRVTEVPLAAICTPHANHAGPNNDASQGNANRIASQASDQHTTILSNSSGTASSAHHNLRDLLRASVQRQSYRIFNSSRLLQAILVSDEIVEADHVETIYPNNPSTAHSLLSQNHGVGGGDGDEDDIESGNMTPSIRQRLTAMEDLLEEQEEEQRYLLEKYRERERIWTVTMILSAVIIIALIVVVFR